MLTRKMLKAMSIESDAIDQIIEAHTETVDALKEQRDGYKAEAEKAKGLSDELDKVKRQLDEASKDNGTAELQKTNDQQAKEIEKLKAENESLRSEFDAYKSDAEAKDAMRAKTEAYKSLLEKAGIAPKYVGKVLRVTSLEDVELDENGEVKDSESALKGIKDEWPEFIAKKQVRGAGTENPPSGGKTPEGMSEIAQRAIQRHNEKYGIEPKE
jgi:DNA repair exonuclease SbcCD ATPase subunit